MYQILIIVRYSQYRISNYWVMSNIDTLKYRVSSMKRTQILTISKYQQYVVNDRNTRHCLEHLVFYAEKFYTRILGSLEQQQWIKSGNQLTIVITSNVSKKEWSQTAVVLCSYLYRNHPPRSWIKSPSCCSRKLSCNAPPLQPPRLFLSFLFLADSPDSQSRYVHCTERKGWMQRRTTPSILLQRSFRNRLQKSKHVSWIKRLVLVRSLMHCVMPLKILHCHSRLHRSNAVCN